MLALIQPIPFLIIIIIIIIVLIIHHAATALLSLQSVYCCSSKEGPSPSGFPLLRLVSPFPAVAHGLKSARPFGLAHRSRADRQGGLQSGPWSLRLADRSLFQHSPVHIFHSDLFQRREGWCGDPDILYSLLALRELHDVGESGEGKADFDSTVFSDGVRRMRFSIGRKKLEINCNLSRWCSAVRAAKFACLHPTLDDEGDATRIAGPKGSRSGVEKVGLPALILVCVVDTNHQHTANRAGYFIEVFVDFLKESLLVLAVRNLKDKRWERRLPIAIEPSGLFSQSEMRALSSLRCRRRCPSPRGNFTAKGAEVWVLCPNSIQLFLDQFNHL